MINKNRFVQFMIIIKLSDIKLTLLLTFISVINCLQVAYLESAVQDLLKNENEKAKDAISGDTDLEG